MSIRKEKENLLANISVRICKQIVLQKKTFSHYEYPKIKEQYGDFQLDKDWREKTIRGLSKESGIIPGVIVDIIEKIEQKVKRVLLPGEYNTDKRFYSKLFKNDTEIITAGMGGDTDYEWNFEKDSPEMGKFDLIISQAMLEHLLNPYKHVMDLSYMLNPGGRLILQTHIPGFQYHRYPIDCVRFYPDWFEETAKRLNLSVHDRYINELRIWYSFSLLKKAGEF